MDSQTVHDASTGFHDIETITFYQPNYKFAPSLLLLALAAILAVYLLSKLIRRKAPLAVEVSALEVVSAEIEKLQSVLTPGKADISQLSLTFRNYLASQFDSNCSEMTFYELKKSLPEMITLRAPQLRQSDKELIVDESLQLLGLFESLIYAPNSEISSSNFKERCTAVSELVKKIDQRLKHYDQQQITIISQSKIER